MKKRGRIDHITTHEEQPVFMKKIEGQIRGVQKMIEEKRYCVDILTRLHSISLEQCCGLRSDVRLNTYRSASETEMIIK